MQVGVAWRVWDASIVFSNWMIANRELFTGKNVLALGCGCCGVEGFVAAHFAKHVVLSDIDNPKIIGSLKDNVKLNTTTTAANTNKGATTNKSKQATSAAAAAATTANAPPLPKINKLEVIPIDWTADMKKTLLQKHPSSFLNGKADVVIGTEIMYDDRLTPHLANVINYCLSPSGLFVGITLSTRAGVRSFMQDMANVGFAVEAGPPPQQHTIDAADLGCGVDRKFYASLTLLLLLLLLLAVRF
eukprot:GEZU01018272.1.p1 GENE.GEZU01018272.1~~GEZU01018272.1.p1  ORF type:complete len:245 (-),score=81.73 GEZU01018272.1:236-970(-)